jgi:hypothetical protein
MPPRTLKERVTALERQVAEMRAVLANGDLPDDWRRTLGMFSNDPGMQELFAEALKIREADRQRARQRVADRQPKL